MVEITISNDNFNALMNAHVKERVLIKHKNLQGEICLEKLYDKLPKKQNEVMVAEALDGWWRAILVKGVD